MRDEVVAAERAREVREAARAWRRAGFIGEETLTRVVTTYPDDRQRFGPGFRALAFIFTVVAACALMGLFFTLFDFPSSGPSLLGWSFVLAALTELQRGPMRRADSGSDNATALISVPLAVFGVISAGDPSSRWLLIPFLTATCALCAIATWRWGDTLFPLAAGLAGFGLLAQTDHGRILWILVASLLIPACLRASRDARLSPSHRQGAVVLGAISILAVYGAIHIWSWDQRLIEAMHSAAPSSLEARPSTDLRALAILATALLPPGLLLTGWRRREPLLLYAGLLLIGASIATIRLYRQVMPLSLALILLGGVCIALALGVRRWLRSGEEGERDGFTADPLFDNTNRTEAIRSVVAMASFTPAAQPSASRPAFEGGGGGFGGGGATGSYE